MTDDKEAVNPYLDRDIALKRAIYLEEQVGILVRERDELRARLFRERDQARADFDRVEERVHRLTLALQEARQRASALSNLLDASHKREAEAKQGNTTSPQ